MTRSRNAGWWQPGALLQEVGANLRARRGRYASLALVVSAVVCGLTWADLSAGREALSAKRLLAEAGGGVIVVARDGGQLDAGLCTGLSGQAHIVAAGGIRRGDVVRFAHGPGTPFQSVYFTGGLLNVVNPQGGPAGEGVVLATSAARELGVVRGSWLDIDNGRLVPVANVVDTEPRAQGLSRTVFIPVDSHGDVDQCWVEFADGALDTGTKLLPAWFAVDGLTLTPLVDRNLGTRDFVKEWQGRPMKHGWLLGGVLISAYVMLLGWRRQAELALYVLLGSTRAMVSLLVTLELWAVGFVGGVLGMLWGVALAAQSGPVASQVLTHGLRAGGLCLCLTLALVPFASVLIARTDLVSMLKERPG